MPVTSQFKCWRGDHPPTPEVAKTLFESRVLIEESTGCWLWCGSIMRFGGARPPYGRFTYGGRDYAPAHQFSYELYVGPIPEGLSVLHRCDFTLCVCPDHLWVGTQADNMKDMAAKGRSRKGIPCSRTWTRIGAKGENSGRALVTWDQVHKMREQYECKEHTQQELAELNGLSRQAVGYIVRHETWIDQPAGGY